MRTSRVTVVPYDSAWKDGFEKIKEELVAALFDLIEGVEHVGSTAVEGMWAKPCIDIDLVIKDYPRFGEVVNRLAGIGYIHEGDLGIKDREAFRYDAKPHLLKHHLYVCPAYSRELERHVRFRDFLRSSPDAVESYSRVKSEGAKLYPDDIDAYAGYKEPCIRLLYHRCGLI